MKQFSIAIHSFAEIQAFVSLAIAQPFEVMVGNNEQCISGKSLMGMLGLNYRRPILVSVNCDDESFRRFRQAAAPFLVA